MSLRPAQAAAVAAAATQLTPATPTDMVRLTRRIHVCITGTLSNFFAEGPSAATWKPLDGKQIALFGHGTDVTDLASSTNALRNAYICSCKVIEQKSTFPVPLGISMPCIPYTEYVETGKKYAFTCLPMSSNATPLTLFEADASQSEGFEWRKRYPEYTDTNLDSHNVRPVLGCPYVFVYEKHPIIALLRANSDLLGSKIDDHSKIDGEWFKVSRQVLVTCCQTLRNKVLSRISFNDLNLFQLQLHRLDSSEWTELGDALLEHITGDDPAAILERPCSFMARIELTYEIPH